MQRVILILCLLSTLGIAINGFSGETKYLGDFSIKDFENGKFVNVSLNQNGTLSLSPNIVEVFKKEDILFVWCVLKDVSGNIYFGTGNKARVYRLSKDGKLDLIYQHENATSISSLTIDSNGNLYAALSPESTI
ncbi:MAG: hypothetical protein OEV44_11945, partial [Spirochaetota bacterium]|nr:hypothetical protein [Spirochaetota bacterium]